MPLSPESNSESDLEPTQNSIKIVKQELEQSSTVPIDNPSTKKRKISPKSTTKTTPKVKSSTKVKPENNESAAKSVWTPEQDAYFTKLKTDPVTSKLKPQEIQNLFEEKFNTGRSLESLKQRWFKVLKFAVVELNADQEARLQRAIDAVKTTEFTFYVAEQYKKLAKEEAKEGDGIKELTKGFIDKWMKKNKNKPKNISATNMGNEETVDTED